MKKAVAIIILFAAILGVISASADGNMVFILCNPESHVNVRKTPENDGIEIGRLDFGDGVQTDGRIRNGFLHVTGITEAGDGWIFTGYVVNDQPEKVNAWATVTASGRVMAYRWINGRKNGWVKVCTDIRVLAISEEWSVTSRGYIRTEYLEVWYE